MQKIVVCIAQALLKGGVNFPAYAQQPARIHEFTRGAVWFGGIGGNFAPEPYHAGYHMSDIHNGMFHTASHVDVLKIRKFSMRNRQASAMSST